MDYSGKRPFQEDQESPDPVSKKRYSSSPNLEYLKPQVFNDPVHGFIEFDPLLVKIIHTPQFQRLKDIKQLGVCYWVFPGASHNRFEHSLGTAFLCGKMIGILQEKHRGTIDITDTEVLCVKIAGLCHDLGHGPFSHFFDGVYIPRVRKEREKSQRGPTSENTDGAVENGACEKTSKWCHEEASCELFDQMIKENPGLKEAFEERKLREAECSFIKELIKGKDPRKDEVERICKISHEPKWFLYEIVSNKRNGIDCDKFDYFARDCLNVGVKSNFDFRRYFHNIRILPIDGHLQVCVRDKEVLNLYELFHTRWSLHHRVYQHKTHAAIEELLTEALLKVDEKIRISSSIYDMRRYVHLTDSIIYDILRNESQDEDIKEAQELLLRIQRRDLYKFCGQTQQLPENDYSKKDRPRDSGQVQGGTAQAELVRQLDPGPSERDIAQEIANLSENSLNANQVFVAVINIHFGMKHHDPVDSVYFFNKDNKPMKLRKSQVSSILPSQFHERYFRVYAKSRKNTEVVQKYFEAWCKKHNYPVPHMLEGDPSGYFSPANQKENGSHPKGIIDPRNLAKEFQFLS